MEEVTVLIAFGYGVLSFASPCILPLIPVYLANISGAGAAGEAGGRWRSFTHSLSFVVGFTLVFTLWGAGAGLIGSALIPHLGAIRQAIGWLLIAFGLVMLASLKIPWLNFEKRLRAGGGRRASLSRSFMIGAIFPVAWTPCASWVLGSILLLAGTSESTLRGAYLLAVYSLGLGLPFLAAGVALDYLAPFLRKISRLSTVIYAVSAVLLIGVGILLVTNRLVWFLGVI